MNNTEIADRIMNHISSNGLKQKFVAEKAGYDPKKLNSMLKGRTRIQATDIENICFALGAAPDEFLKPKKPEVMINANAEPNS